MLCFRKIMDHIECIFCKSPLPAKLDAGFEKHMELHKAEFNLEFLFASMLLDPPGMEKTVEFMLSLNTSRGEAVDKKKTFSSFFGKTEVKEEYPDVKDNIIDDESYEKITICKSKKENKEDNGNANVEKILKYMEEETIMKSSDERMMEVESSDERNLERLIMIQDDHPSVADNPLEESSFPSPAVTEEQEEEKKDKAVPGEILQQPRKRGRPRKYPVAVTGPTPAQRVAGEKDRRLTAGGSCNMKFTNYFSQRRHMIKYHGQHACQLCSLTFHTEQDLQRHMENPKDRHDPDYGSTVCFICGAQFKQYRFLKDHKKSVHELGEKKKCELCPEFVINLKKHLRKCHTELKICDICQKPMKCLENHMLTMHGTEEDKKFRCEECGKGFILRDKLVAHRVIHSKEKPFPCRFNCGYASKTAGNRRKHEEGVHQMISRERKKPIQNQAVHSENKNMAASEKAEEDQGTMEMDPNIYKKVMITESPKNVAGDVSEEEEDIDLDDLEEVPVINGQTEGGPLNLVPSQLIEMNFPLSQIISSSLPSSTTNSTPLVSELSDPAHQEYQEICSFFK